MQYGTIILIFLGNLEQMCKLYLMDNNTYILLFLV